MLAVDARLMERVLITGASGLLGGNLVHVFSRKYDVVASSWGHELDGERYRSLRFDITDPAETMRAVMESAPDTIVHCAAETGVDLCQRDPEHARRVNVEGTANVVAAANAAGAVLVYISTDGVFDGLRGNYAETDSPAPVNVYAQTKLEGEGLVRQDIPAHLIVRTSFYGWSTSGTRSLAEWVRERAREGDAVPGWTDVFFSPILATDLGEAVQEALERGLRGTYHAGGSERCSKFEFARQVCAVFGYDPSLVQAASVQDAALSAPRPHDTSLDVGQLAKDLGRGLPGLQEGLERLRDQEREYVPLLRSLVRATGGA